jgi:hypothetical protein
VTCDRYDAISRSATIVYHAPGGCSNMSTVFDYT